MRLGLGLLLIASLVGCGDSALDTGDGDYMDDDLPMGDCPGTGGCPQGTGSASGGVPVGAPCDGPADCSEGAACVAPWSDGEVGEFTCSATCVPNDDESMWCLGDSACCDPSATCNARGLCRTREDGDDTAGEPSTGAGTQADASASGSDAGSEESSAGEAGESSSTG